MNREQNLSRFPSHQAITPTVYLAGPITGCTKTETNDWRIDFAKKLAFHNIRGVSPLRCEPLIGERYSLDNPCPKFGTAKAIGAKNLFDVRACDLTLAYLPQRGEKVGKWRDTVQSYGTIGELAGAHFIGKPTILVTDDPYVAAHSVLMAFSGWVLPTLDDALEVIVGLLGGYTLGGKNV